MAKSNGLGSYLFVDGYDLSGDVGQISDISSPAGVQNVSGINVTGTERIYLRHDGHINFNSFFNDAASQEHLTLRGKSAGADRQTMFFMGAAIGNAAAALHGKQLTYDPAFGADGSLISSIDCVGNLYGLDWGKQLTAGKRTDTTATNGSSLDNTAASSTGWVAYLQVFAFTGTSVTVTIQDSADNAAFAGFTGSAFTAASAVGFQRIAGVAGATVRRYLRVATTGTFSNAVFAVMLSREPYAL